MKRVIALLSCLICASAFADTSTTPPTPAPVGPRVSIFSTTVDWQGITGLPLSQYTGSFVGTNKSLLRDGLILYYLDSFPCYGEADSVRVWLDRFGKTMDSLRLVCIYPPKEIKFAWRNAGGDAEQAETTGILVCPVTGDYTLQIDLSKCEKGPDWSKYK